LSGLPSYSATPEISALSINLSPLEAKQELEGAGVPKEYLENRENYVIYELQKFKFLVKSLPFDNSGQRGSYQKNAGFIFKLSSEPLLYQNFGMLEGNIILANLINHFHAKQVFNNVVDAGVPRGYIESYHDKV
jgi:hypothetical protein